MTLINISIKGGPGSGNWGHRGIPGKVGGSSPRGVGLVSGTPGKSGYDKTAASILYQAAKDDGGWVYASVKTRSKVKAEVVEAISRKANTSKRVVNDILLQWATTSNDDDYVALSLQEAAAEEFGTELSGWQKGKMRVYGNMDVNKVRRRQERAVLKIMHDTTQMELRKAGYEPGDTVTLYRGMNVDANNAVGNVVDYKGNAIESWSVDSKVAREFVYDVSTPYYSVHGTVLGVAQGVILSMQVPIENIVSTAATGLGCLSEGEFVILGNIPGSKASVVFASSERG